MAATATTTQLSEVDILKSQLATPLSVYNESEADF